MSNSSTVDKQLNLGAACFRCRGFRHACDRRKPSCSRCSRRKTSCVYPEAAPSLKSLQKETESFGDRLKLFREQLETGEIKPLPPQFHDIEMAEADSPYSQSLTSSYSEDSDNDDTTSENDRPKRSSRKVASTNTFSVYPCIKCFKDLQQCDLTLPKCSRCEANNFDCTFKQTEPKVSHVSQVLTTMNKVMDHWQDSIDRMAKDLAQKTRILSIKAKIKPTPQTSWRITTTTKGIFVDSNVKSYCDFSTLVDQFKRTITITPNKIHDNTKNSIVQHEMFSSELSAVNEPLLDFDGKSAFNTTSCFTIWSLWAHSTNALPQDYPIDISQELTDNLIELYCRTPCCSSIRLPIIDTVDFLKRYRSLDISQRPSTILIYAVCAMAARNAFQLHVWSKRPSFEAPHYNMGKALSVAYCLRGRELLSDCFDEPTFDNCQAAFLLSYCNYQNGYPSVIYFYEWIAYSMALQLGLYDDHRELTQNESMLVWCIYSCNAWYKALQLGDPENNNSQGLDQCKPKCPIPTLLPRPDQTLFDKEGEPDTSVIQYHVWNTWVYLITLQVFRDQSMARLAAYQPNEKLDLSLPQDLIAMQETLKEFHSNLPKDWQSPNLEATKNNKQTCCSSTGNYNVDVKSFAQYCTAHVILHYCINEIILYQPFTPMDRPPTTPIAIQSLETSLNAANVMSQIFELMVQQPEECHVPLVGFLFANIVYRKLLSYTSDEYYYETGRSGLLRSIDISKSSMNYTYDFEMARTLVQVMEQDIQFTMMQQSSNSFSLSTDSSTSSSPSPSIPAPSTRKPLDQINIPTLYLISPS